MDDHKEYSLPLHEPKTQDLECNYCKGKLGPPKEYRPKMCSPCYSKKKLVARTLVGQYKTKYGEWICGECDRVHSKRRKFCFDCGKPQHQAAWSSLD